MIEDAQLRLVPQEFLDTLTPEQRRKVEEQTLSPKEVGRLRVLLLAWEHEQRAQWGSEEHRAAIREARERHADLLQLHESLAHIGYVAYGEEANWKSYEGKPMPLWEELPEHIRRKWRAATYRIVQQALSGEWLPESLRHHAVARCRHCRGTVISYIPLGYDGASRTSVSSSDGEVPLWFHTACAEARYGKGS